MILTVDSSTNVACVSLTDNGDILYYKDIDDGKTHSQKLMPMIDECLKSSGVSPYEIDAFAAVIGPGSFTGLRIGIASIQGLAYSLNKPCIAVSSLDAMAYGVEKKEGIIIPLIDARNAQAYSAFYDSSLDMKKIAGDMAESVEEIARKAKSIESEVLFIGDGAYKNKELILNFFGESAKFLDDKSNYTAGNGALLLAQKYFNSNNILTPSELLPYYYRDTSAKKRY